MERKVPGKQVRKQPQTAKVVKLEPPQTRPISPPPEHGLKVQTNYSKKAIKAFTIGKVPITYREKEGSPEYRRYYVGFVQMAFVRLEKNKTLTAYLTNGSEEVGLKGINFPNEKDMNLYLEKELLG